MYRFLNKCCCRYNYVVVSSSSIILFQMAPFERASMTSYSTLMVTMALSASVSRLQPSEICVTSILTSPGHSRSSHIRSEREIMYGDSGWGYSQGGILTYGVFY